MRVLHLVGRSHRRGAEIVADELARSLEAHGHTGRLLAVGPGHDARTDPSIPTLTDQVDQRPLALITASRRLRADLGADPVDVIVAHGGSAMQVSALAGLGGGPAILHQLIMGMPVDDRGPVWRRWTSWVLSRASVTVSLTEALTDEIRALGHSGPVELIPNARSSVRFADLDRLALSRRLRTEVGIGPGSLLMGFVGHLVAQKRPEVAVEVLAAVRRAGVDAHLVVAGEGSLADLVGRTAHDHDVSTHVTLLGHRPDVEAVLGGIDLLVLTSDDEGMPGIAIEAQMAGTPVISFPVGGVSEVVGHGETGWVLDDHDPAAMAAVVVDLAGDPDRRHAMGTAARVRAERFSMERAAERYHRLLVEISRPRS